MVGKRMSDKVTWALINQRAWDMVWEKPMPQDLRDAGIKAIICGGEYYEIALAILRAGVQKQRKYNPLCDA